MLIGVLELTGVWTEAVTRPQTHLPVLATLL
jgi:hypothetical protein